MHITIVINGTRGDVQPMVALAIGLRSKGHEMQFFAPPENQALVEEYGFRFIPFGPNYKKLLEESKKKKGSVSRVLAPKIVVREALNQIHQLPGLIQQTDLILGVGFVLGVHTVADLLKVPYRFVIFYPSLLGPANTDPRMFRLAFRSGKILTNLFLRKKINRFRRMSQLSTVQGVWDHWMGEEVLVACDPELNPVREGISFKTVQTGSLILKSSGTLSKATENFLSQGPPPVFIGFGSNPLADKDQFLQLIRQVAASTQQRLLVSPGWSGLSGESTNDILFIGEEPFDILFPHLSAIVFHGGTGTLALAARAGLPMAAFPFLADQFDNRNRIAALGIGPKTCDFKDISAEKLILTVNDLLNNPDFKRVAVELAKKLESKDGLESTIQLIESISRK